MDWLSSFVGGACAAAWPAAALGCLAGHALCDGLQGRLSRLKRRRRALGEPVAPARSWAPFLALHAGAHGAAVGVVLWDPWLGALEAAAHAGIDFMKCEGWIGTVADQALHVACKVLWVGLWAWR